MISIHELARVKLGKRESAYTVATGGVVLLAVHLARPKLLGFVPVLAVVISEQATKVRIANANEGILGQGSIVVVLSSLKGIQARRDGLDRKIRRHREGLD